MSQAHLTDRLADLCNAFLKELGDNRTELTNLLATVDQNLLPAERERLIALTHSLAGRAGTFGFPGLSNAAAEVHDMVESNACGQREVARTLMISVARVLDPPPRTAGS